MDDEEKKVSPEAANPDGGDQLKDDEIFGDDEPKSEGKSPETSDGRKKEEAPKDDGKSARAKNSHEAEQRRLREENERMAKENAQLKAEAQKAEFRGKAGAVPKAVLQDLGLTSIESERDLKLAQAYQDAEAKGSDDPRADAYASLYKEMVDAEEKKKQAEEKAAKEKQQADAKAKEIYDSFIAKFGKKAMGELLDANSDFRHSAFSKYANADNLQDVYQDYLDTQKTVKKAAGAEAKAMGASYGNFDTSATSPAKHDPSSKEINDAWEKILKNAGRV